MATGFIRRNTLTTLISITSNTNSALNYHEVSKLDHKLKTILLIYPIISLIAILFYIILTCTEHYLKIHASIKESLLLFSIYSIVIPSSMYSINRLIYKQNFTEWLTYLFKARPILLSSGSINELRLNNIYKRCIEESLLTGTRNDIQVIETYIKDLQELASYKQGSHYKSKSFTISNMIRLTGFLLAGFIASSWSESFKIGDFSFIKQILPTIFIVSAAALFTLETIPKLRHYSSDKKQINKVCEDLIQIKHIVIDSTKECSRFEESEK